MSSCLKIFPLWKFLIKVKLLMESTALLPLPTVNILVRYWSLGKQKNIVKI